MEGAPGYGVCFFPGGYSEFKNGPIRKPFFRCRCLAMLRRPNTRTWLTVLGLGLALVALISNISVASAQGECGGARVIVEQGQPSPFVLPEGRHGTLRVEPDARLRISASGVPPDAEIQWGLRGFSTHVTAGKSRVGSSVVLLDVADFSAHLRGLFEVDATLLYGATKVCTIPFRVQIAGFGGTVAAVAIAASTVGGLAVLGSAPIAASGMNAKLKAKVQLSRRKPQGWRRWMPVPAWKRTLISTVIGAFTGIGIAIVLQQAGMAPLAWSTALKGMIMGGGLTFGVGYSLGALWTYLKPPQQPD